MDESLVHSHGGCEFEPHNHTLFFLLLFFCFFFGGGGVIYINFLFIDLFIQLFGYNS